jgi:hypothetical protein
MDLIMRFNSLTKLTSPLLFILSSCGVFLGPGTGQPPYVYVGDRETGGSHYTGLSILFVSAIAGTESISLEFDLEYAPIEEKDGQIPYSERFAQIENISVEFVFRKIIWDPYCGCVDHERYQPLLTIETGVNIDLNNQEPSSLNPVPLLESQSNRLSIDVPLASIDELNETGLEFTHPATMLTPVSQLTGQYRQFGISIEDHSFGMFIFPNE